MFVVPSGVVVATRATAAERASGRRRAVAATRTGAHRDRYGVAGNISGRPGVNAGAIGRGSAPAAARGPDVSPSDLAPSAAPAAPAASAPIAQAVSRARLTR
jgi:hypothetical protein